MILLDTSGILAAIDASQKHHDACVETLKNREEPLLLSPFVLAEVDYLLATRVGLNAEIAFLAEVARGAYRLERFQNEDIDRAIDVIERYADLGIGIADASIVVLADHYRVRDVLTLDHRHFETLRCSNGRPFRLLP